MSRVTPASSNQETDRQYERVRVVTGESGRQIDSQLSPCWTKRAVLHFQQGKFFVPGSPKGLEVP